MEEAVLAPYDNEQFAPFTSERLDLEKAYHHLLFARTTPAFALK
jgi:peptide/nickel transport system substrate-binding protein